MESLKEADTVRHAGIRGDRYEVRTGYWTNIDECEVTLINAEDLDDIEKETGISVNNGEHRRNIVVRGIHVKQLLGVRFRIGDSVMLGTRLRPPCGYIQKITVPGMTRALGRCGGICASVIDAGKISVGDSVEVIPPSV